MIVTIDLYETAAQLRRNIDALVRSLPDDLILQACDHWREHPPVSEEEANEDLRAALTAVLFLAHRAERDRRLNVLLH